MSETRSGWKCPQCEVIYWVKPLPEKCFYCDEKWVQVDVPMNEVSELRITLRVKHEPDEAPNTTELQILRDLIKDWCTEFCLERQELKIDD